MQLNWKTGYKEQSYDLSLQCGGFSDGYRCYIPQEWGPRLQTLKIPCSNLYAVGVNGRWEKKKTIETGALQ